VIINNDDDDGTLSSYFMTLFHNAAHCGTTEQQLGTGWQTELKLALP